MDIDEEVYTTGHGVGSRVSATAVLERDVLSTPALPPATRSGQAIDLLGAALGRVVGYVRTHRSSDVRADAVDMVVARPLVALAASLVVGYMVGRAIRR